ncbi:MAG: iron-sulfur cluster assembly scaffold protein [Candidatus Aenigmatarchaeota archaeon]
MIEMYTKKVMEHFLNPKNVGEIKNPSGVGEVGNIVCGDVMKLYIKVKNDTIVEIKFKTLGCAAAIATSSVITELAKNKRIEDALKIRNEDVIKILGGLPPIKVHCSLLAVDALKEAIYDYLRKSKRQIPKDLENAHERIEREKRIVKEKFKDFIKRSEKILDISEKSKNKDKRKNKT